MTIIWCMVPEISSTTDRIFCHLGSFFPFYPHLQLEKSKFWKNEKSLEISSFYTIVLKIMIICYTVPEIWCADVILIFHFGQFFYFLLFYFLFFWLSLIEFNKQLWELGFRWCKFFFRVVPCKQKRGPTMILILC